jgi:hypothetical protein
MAQIGQRTLEAIIAPGWIFTQRDWQDRDHNRQAPVTVVPRYPDGVIIRGLLCFLEVYSQL